MLFSNLAILLSFYNIQTSGDDNWCSGVFRLAYLDGGLGICWYEFGLFVALGFGVEVG
jgi:hypothetical protein